MKKIRDILSLPLIKNTLKLSSSSALMMLLPLIVTPILSRLYTPEEYGDWGVFSSVFYIVNSFLFLSYENSIVKTNERDDVPNLIGVSAISASLVIFLTFVTFFIGRLLGVGFFVDFPSLFLLIIILIAQAAHTLCNCIANREKKYGVMSISNIISGVTQASFRILFGIIPLVTYGLIVGNVIAQVATTIFIIIFLRYFFNKSFFQNLSVKKMRELAYDNRKFPLYDAPARLIEFSVGNLALIILTFYWSKEVIGCYSMIMQFLLLPIAVVGSAMGNVFYREISENVNDKQTIRQTTKRASRITFGLCFLPMLFLACGGDHILVYILGERWKTAGIIALCLSIQSVPVILTEPLLPLYRSLNRQETRFRWNLLNFFFSLGVLLIMSNITDNLNIVLIIYSIAIAIVRYLMFYSLIHLAGLKVLDVSRYFYYLSIIAFIVLGIRLYIEILMC